MRAKTQVHNSIAAPNPRGERGGFRVISLRLMTLKPHSPLGRVGSKVGFKIGSEFWALANGKESLSSMSHTIGGVA